MAVVEAAVRRKPVVVTDRVNIRKEIEQAGAGMATSCLPAELSNGIITLLEDRVRAKQMGANGRNLLTCRFALNEIAQTMIQTHQSVLAGRSLAATV